jgi:hypothetical protein
VQGDNVERQGIRSGRVLTEEAAVTSLRVMKKQHRGRRRRAKRSDPTSLGIRRDVGCRLQEGVPSCSSGMA